MAIEYRLIGGQMLAVDADTNQLSVIVSGLEFTGDVHLGEVQLQGTDGNVIQPASQSDVAAIVTQLTTALALPTGAATEAKQDSIVTLIGTTTDPAMGTVNKWLSLIDTQTAKFGDNAGGAFIRQDSNSTIARETGGNLAAILAELQSQQTYDNVLAGSLTLSGSAEKLIPDWAGGTTYAAAKFTNHNDKIWYSLQSTTGDEPGDTGSEVYWQEVTPRAVTLWVNDDGSDIKRGSALRQESYLYAGGMKEKLSVDTDGLLAIYVIGPTSAVLELEVAE